MKIAYCFSGHLRTFRQNTNLLTTMMDRYPGDIFVYTYGRHNAGTGWSGQTEGKELETTAADIQWIRDTYPGVVDVYVNPAPDGNSTLPPGLNKMGFRVSLAGVHAMRNAYEQRTQTRYDLVFGARFDLVFGEPIVLPDPPEPDVAYGGYNLTQIEAGLDAEVFVYGRPDVMDRLFLPAIPPEEVAKIPEYGFVGEALFTSIRRARGLQYKTHRLPYFLLRESGLLTIRI